MAPGGRAASRGPMSPQQSERQQPQGLFSGKIHFRLPSAEEPFALPAEPRPDTEAMAAVVIKKDEPQQR
jgi:hypothetical protein